MSEIQADLLAAAEERLRALHIRIDAARWTLDSARSKLRKAQPTTGYRSSPGIGDKPWDLAAAEAEVEAAELGLLVLALEVAPDPALVIG